MLASLGESASVFHLELLKYSQKLSSLVCDCQSSEALRAVDIPLGTGLVYLASGSCAGG